MYKSLTTAAEVSLLPVFAAAVLLASATALFSGCYTLRQGTTMLGYLGRAVPLETLAGGGGSDSSTGDQPADGEIAEAEKNRRFAELVRDIRDFAAGELGLEMSKNYTRYVQLDRDYLAAVVSASAADSFTRHEWKYPVVGSLPYKGFFNVDGARKERAKLEKKGLDTWVRGVDAFSTLGWFRDPLYSYMRDYPPGRLADLIIHESTHATVFLKGEAQFNEELAEFIGSEGAKLYVESRFGAGSQEYATMFGDDENSRQFVVFVRELIAELQILYNSEKGREEKLAEKEWIINAAKKRFDEEYETRFSDDNYRGFSSLPINNAYLELYQLYYAEDNYIAGLYEKSGKNLSAFIAAAKTMPKKGPGGRERFALALEASAD